MNKCVFNPIFASNRLFMALKLIYQSIYLFIYIYIHIYIYIYVWYSFWAKVFRFYIESWPEWDSNPRPHAYRAHALNH